MVILFALIACIYLNAPWWMYLVGFVCLLMDN